MAGLLRDRPYVFMNRLLPWASAPGLLRCWPQPAVCFTLKVNFFWVR